MHIKKLFNIIQITYENKRDQAHFPQNLKVILELLQKINLRKGELNYMDLCRLFLCVSDTIFS